MNADPTDGPLGIESELLDEADLALAKYADLIESGCDAAGALAAAVSLYPDQAELLADYAIQCSAAVSAKPIRPDPAADLALLAAYALAPRADSVGARLVDRLTEIGLAESEACRLLRIGASVLAKLDRRMISIATIPETFLAALSNVLRVRMDSVRDYLSGIPTLMPASEYRSHRPPSARAQAFDIAIDTSFGAGEISEQDRDYWLEADRR
jgi:hypothetical protein